MKCEICQKGDYQTVYQGKIRNGQVGNYIDGEILGCPVCKIQRLPQYLCIPENYYLEESYRKHVGESTDIQEYIKNHDHEQLDHLIACRRLGVDFRGKSVLDVGAGAGLFLDWIRGIAQGCSAVEPCDGFHDHLKYDPATSFDRILNFDYAKYGLYKDAKEVKGKKFDVIVSFVTIEHVKDPVAFLSEMKDVLADDGVIVISTPNLHFGHDMKNFYRNQHRWYFNTESLGQAINRVGLMPSLWEINDKYIYVTCKADSK